MPPSASEDTACIWYIHLHVGKAPIFINKKNEKDFLKNEALTAGKNANVLPLWKSGWRFLKNQESY